MTETESFRDSEAAREWGVRLACGHPVTIPLDVTAPIVMALILEHPASCSAEPRDLLDPPAWVPPEAVGVAFR
jgi:hypothetical protein